MTKTKYVPLGSIVVTRGINDLLEKGGDTGTTVAIGRCLARHMTGDWGEVSEEDRQVNDRAVEGGERLLSAYTLPDEAKTKIWIITEYDRSVTTVLLPEEY